MFSWSTVGWTRIVQTSSGFFGKLLGRFVEGKNYKIITPFDGMHNI